MDDERRLQKVAEKEEALAYVFSQLSYAPRDQAAKYHNDSYSALSGELRGYATPNPYLKAELARFSVAPVSNRDFAAFVNHEEKTVFIAVRGTDFTFAPDLATDAFIVLGIPEAMPRVSVLENFVQQVNR